MNITEAKTGLSGCYRGIPCREDAVPIAASGSVAVIARLLSFFDIFSKKEMSWLFLDHFMCNCNTFIPICQPFWRRFLSIMTHELIILPFAQIQGVLFGHFHNSYFVFLSAFFQCRIFSSGTLLEQCPRHLSEFLTKKNRRGGVENASVVRSFQFS